MPKGALSNLKVLDLTHYIAGPYCTKLLADMGADVVKVEKPREGDGARRMGPFPGDIPDPEKSGLFLYLNTNKRGITLNLKTEIGKNIFKELVREVDVLVESFEPKVMPELGLDYEILEKINPRLVMTSISNFGQTGPYRDYKAQEINLAAIGGSMHITGNPYREPLKEPASTFQFAAGTDACAATLAATYHQKKAGIGQHIDLSIMETIISCLGPPPQTGARIGFRQQKRRGPYSMALGWPDPIAANGVYPCKDGYVEVVLKNPDDAVLAAALTGVEEIGDPNIGCIGYGRIVQDDRLNRLLLRGLKDMTKEEIFREAQSLRLFWTSVKNIEEVMNWTQYRERGFWIEIDHPKTGPLTYAKTPFSMSKTLTKIGRAPLLGEHNQEVYCQRFGYSAEDVVRLGNLNVI